MVQGPGDRGNASGNEGPVHRSRELHYGEALPDAATGLVLLRFPAAGP